LATWDTKGLKTSKKGEIFFFVGCLPYLDVVFSLDIGVNLIKIAEDSIKILNSIGIKPVLSKDQVCCGHDSLWGGDAETFEKLAHKNTDIITESGASTVITSCAECYRTLKTDYHMDVEVFHITQFIADKIANKEVKLNEVKRTVTFHDPCRLGRYMGEYEAPRKILSSIPGLEFAELSRSQKDAQCCGVGAWMACNEYSKILRVNKIKDVIKTGADTLALACPKCQIHLKCLLSEKGEEKAIDANIDLVDITSLVWGAIAGEED
jgi:Fe-S oxidoreductase